ncbi:MAG: hypothetical protein H5T41_05515 [Methanomassiliicoccales archaeon]|nr:hypothetical protein [Methanomassiliicoccales archaeon]
MPTHAERMIWSMGDANDIVVFDTPIGTIGGMICYERHMALQKAAMASLGRRFTARYGPAGGSWEHHPGEKKRLKNRDSPFFCDLGHAMKEYAFENQVFVISVGSIFQMTGCRLNVEISILR